MINAIGIALTGLNSASLRLSASAANIANMQTGGSLSDKSTPPYSALTTESKSLGQSGGVYTQIVEKDTGFVPAYDPNSPFADENGMIGVPNVDLAEEIVDMKLAEISYKANIKTIDVAGSMFDELIESID